VKKNPEADKNFLAIMQRPNETLVELKKRCEDDYAVFLGMGLPAKAENVRAMHFMCALDIRFADYVIFTENDASRGIAMSDTIKKVFDEAFSHKSKGVKVAKDGSLSR
jgi:hypothetical protein